MPGDVARKSMSKKVKVYDFETEQVSEIPESELAPGMVIAEVEGVGRVWIEAAKLKRTATFRHPPFSDEARAFLSANIRDKLNEVFPMTLEQWEEGFRRDANPEREIALWFHVARVYEHCLKEFYLDAHQRKELFNVLASCMSSPRGSVFTVTQPLEQITKEQADRAIALYFHWNDAIGDK